MQQHDMQQHDILDSFGFQLTFDNSVFDVRWYRAPQRELDRRNNDRSEPLRTPAMAGGLFAIDKEYFYHLGAYDQVS